MEFTLPSLPYQYGALEPYIDCMTMEIHHTKHHQAYINNLNAALANHPELQNKSISQLMIDLPTLPSSVFTAVQNQGGGHFNHSFFWPLMKKNGGGEPQGSFKAAILESFGTFQAFQDSFNKSAREVFGSGWAWACLDQSGKLVVLSTPNQNCPLSDGLHPVMGLDVWEHAYYLLYQNKRPDYINAWWNVINWEQVEENYTQLVR